MTRRATGITLAALVALAAPAVAQQYFLYSPEPVTEVEKDRPHDGVLVREVPIRKGDTLYGLSRRFSGHGSYFSQILLFNNISDPNLIYAGDTLRVPVGGKEKEKGAIPPRKGSKDGTIRKGTGSAPAPPTTAEQPPAGRTSAEEAGARKGATPGGSGKRTSAPAAPAPAATRDAGRAAAAVPPSEPAGQKLYERAMRAYRQDDCRNALELFDQFLTVEPGSPLAADANLYKAECYLKMSAQ